MVCISGRAGGRRNDAGGVERASLPIPALWQGKRLQRGYKLPGGLPERRGSVHGPTYSRSLESRPRVVSEPSARLLKEMARWV